MKRSVLAKELMPLATFARKRKRLQAEVLAHRADRAVRVGHNATLVFENELTVRFQLQEILRLDGTSAAADVQAEVDAYAPLAPDGGNLKATLTLEFSDLTERGIRVAQLTGVENHVWMQVEGSPRIYAIADVDIERAAAERDAMLHHLRFELGEQGARDLKGGRPLSFGIDHPSYNARQIVGQNVRQSLLKDLR